MTILLYVRRKGWTLKSVTVECGHERVHCRDLEDCDESDDAYVEVIRRYILLEGDLTEEQRDRVAWIARRCPIHRTLVSTPRIEDELDLVRVA